jgi:lipopolysaccharide transport system permease protein
MLLVSVEASWVSSQQTHNLQANAVTTPQHLVIATSKPIVHYTHSVSLWDYRSLLLSLAGRDIQARYRQSFLGVYWALLNPVFQAIVFSFAFSTIMRIPTGDLPFLIFYFTGLLYWNLLTNSVNSAMISVSSHAPLLAKVRFPRVILPLSSIIARLFDFALSLLVLALIIAWNRVPIHVEAWFSFVMLLLVLLVAIGLSLITSALNTLYRDVGQIINIVFSLWFFLCPIVYEVKGAPSPYKEWLLVNPLGAAVHWSRESAFYGHLPASTDLFPAAAASVIVLAVGIVVFRHFEPTFTEVL